MFQSARLQLTFWYIIIIAFISILFSSLIFKASTQEFDRIRFMQDQRLERLNDMPLSDDLRSRVRSTYDQSLQVLEDSEKRIAFSLVIINLGVLSLSGVAGYFLAGRTLRPIQKMVDDQNQFISDSSHELRTPLTSLKSEIEVNLRAKKISFAETKKLLRSNLEEVNNLQQLSDNLIKLTQGQNNHHLFIDTPLTEIINEAIKKVSVLAKNKKISIENKINNQVISANAATLTEAFVIILDNAIKYSSSNSKVKMISIKTDHHLLIKVSDQGVGIEEKDLPHLFDRFYRADKSRSKADVPGYGLGLSIAQQIINNHRGIITIESIVDKGTTINIQLPL